MILSPNKVAALYITMIMACVGATSLLATVGVDKLDKATAHQCVHHDWPAKAHQVHMTWCNANGYATK